MSRADTGLDTATLGGGCFWCLEAAYEQLPGVASVQSGYMGGSLPEPTYEQVCSGATGHAEVVQLGFDPEVISYGEILVLFWRIHDPTTLNRQGNDVGTQYRSVIFYHSEAQRQAAQQSVAALVEIGVFADPVVTEIVPAATFYPAEDYHREYYRRNKQQQYCRYVITPKLKKLGLEI